MHTLLPVLALGCTHVGADATVRHGTGEHPGSGIDSGIQGGDSGQDSGGGADSGGGGKTLPDGELRGIWVTRWTYNSPDDVATIMANIAGAGFNTVFFQVRGTMDAYYDSAYEPWASRLSGTLGQDPGWDPLATAVSEGHANGLAVHAYINSFTLWSGTTPPPDTDPPHAYNAHPDWLAADSTGTPMALNSGYVFASPGNPEVRQRLADVARDIADQYEVDGIHLDYIRYPGADYSHDAVSETRYAADDLGLGWADWQREQVDEAVQGVSDAVDIPVTAAVWGIYEDEWGWNSSQGNIDYYQDSRAFVDRGLLDAIVPMIYWPVAEHEGDYTDFRVLIRDHVTHKGTGRVFAGIAADLGYDEVIECIEVAREEGADGVVLFDYSTGLSWLPRLARGAFAE